jgi:hypothetical protein
VEGRLRRRLPLLTHPRIVLSSKGVGLTVTFLVILAENADAYHIRLYACVLMSNESGHDRGGEEPSVEIIRDVLANWLLIKWL